MNNIIKEKIVDLLMRIYFSPDDFRGERIRLTRDDAQMVASRIIAIVEDKSQSDINININVRGIPNTITILKGDLT